MVAAATPRATRRERAPSIVIGREVIDRPAGSASAAAAAAYPTASHVSTYFLLTGASGCSNATNATAGVSRESADGTPLVYKGGQETQHARPLTTTSASR